MESIIQTDNHSFIVDGATIRVRNNQEVQDNTQTIKVKSKVGIVSILPKVQIALGGRLDSFVDALEFSRLPLALNKTVSKGKFSTYNIIRLKTGNIEESIIATLSVYNGIMVGLTYSREVLHNKKFRKLVRLSAMHQISLCNKDDKLKLLKSTQCISTLTGIPRDKLVVIETARSIKVMAKYASRLNLPIFYTFALDKNNYYNLLQISYDINEVVNVLKK